MKKRGAQPDGSTVDRSNREAAGGVRRLSYWPASRPRFLTLGEGGASISVMIGALRGPEHLETIHRYRYYHVPVSAIAGKRSAVQLIAFYEAAARFDRPEGLIQEYARVLRVSQVLRKELPGLAWPGRRGEEAVYYRFDLGPMRWLPQPITNPEGLRMVFRFADLERLQAARTIRDLDRSARPARKPKSDA